VIQQPSFEKPRGRFWRGWLALGVGFCGLTSALGVSVLAGAGPAGGTSRLQFGRLGEVHVHRPAQAPTSFTLLVAGAPGADADGDELVAALVAHGSALVTIDGPRYLEVLNRPGAECQYLGGDFETRSHEVQRRLSLEGYLLSVLAEYSSGAALAAVVLEQSPKGTYAGLLSIDFQPGLDLRRTPCRSSTRAPWLSARLPPWS